MRNNLLIAELKEIVRNKKLLIPLIAILFIPILYSGMFLWAFWDPYDRLHDLPVAVVNNDIGANYEGEKLTLGNELVENLKEIDEFTFQFVDHDQAYKGLNEQKYYMFVEIPESFSENATTLIDDQPRKLQLNYVPNESYNFLSAQIGETAVKEIKATVSKEVTATYAETMFEKMKEMANGFAQAKEGADQLDGGVGKLSTGSNELKDHLHILASKSIEFKDGVSQIHSGTSELTIGTDGFSQGLDQLANGHNKLAKGAKVVTDGSKPLVGGTKEIQSGLVEANRSMESIITGTEQIQDGSDDLTNHLNQFQAGANEVAKGANELHAGIKQMKEQLSGVDDKIANLPLPDEMKTQIAEQLTAEVKEIETALSKLEAGSHAVAGGTNTLSTSASELKSGASNLASKVGELNDGQKQLNVGLGQLVTGSAELAHGANELSAGQLELTKGMAIFDEKLNEAQKGADELNTGAKKLKDGVNSLADSSQQMSDGSQQLADGATELSDGTNELKDGTDEMKTKLKQAADQSSSVQADDEMYDMMGEPVKVATTPVNEVPNYGTGFAPYFLSLGLFVGALLLSIVYPLREPAKRPTSALSWFTGKFGIVVIVGTIQSLLAVALMVFGLGIKVKSMPLFILTTVVTSIAFVTLIQFLVTLFGDPGRFLAILVLILQLTTSAGTFPLELIPEPLQPFNWLLPMTYSVQAYKAVISSGDLSFMWSNLGILLGYMFLFMIMTFAFFRYQFKKEYAVQNPHTE